MIDIIELILSEQFLIRALIVGLMLSLCCALLGVSLVLKRFSMIGDGLSHVGFGAMAIACASGIAPVQFALPIVIVSAVLLLKMNDSGKIKGDAAIALISTGALAVGVMVTSMTTGMNVDIYNYMFGSILTMSDSDVVITGIISLVVIILFVVFYNEIFAVTFDESFAKATGTKVSFYNMLIACLTAVTIVIGMKMMGALLISSLIIFPTISSMRISKSFRSVVLTSILISVFCFLAGLFASIAVEAPTGACIVCVNIVVLVFLFVIQKAVLTKSNVAGKVIASLLCIALLSGFGFTFSFYTDTQRVKKNISVVTTGFVHYDFARQICGEKADITMLLSPGEESHTYEPTAEDIMKIKECDVFVYTGGESESWVEDIISGTDNSFYEVKFTQMIEPERLIVHEDDEHSHEHEKEHTHHSEYDEHVWTSPSNAIVLVDGIYNAVCNADSENTDYYAGRYNKYIEQLRQLDNKFKSITSVPINNNVIIADRFPLAYLFDEYGIKYHSAFSGCSAQVQANPVTIAFLNEQVRKNDIDVIFKVDFGNGNVAQTISSSTGAGIETLYSCHTVSKEFFENGETYISLMYRNLEGINKAIN